MLKIGCIFTRTLPISSCINVITNNICKRYLNTSLNTEYKNKVKIMAETGFKFSDYDCLGFDLDNTICRYKISKMITMEYESISNYLVNNKSYSPKHLKKPIEDNIDFLLKGLILDVKKGNILRIDQNGYILHGCHGTRELKFDEIVSYYGPQARWDVLSHFTKDPLITWNGPLSEQMRTLLDYFDMPAGLIFARVVDTLDEINDGKPLEEYNIWPDVIDAMQDMFQREHFSIDKGGYFPLIKASPHEYMHKCSDKLIKWFKSLRSNNKILFLITGSNIDFASHTAETSLGSDWTELFDIVICYAKKPGFFTQERPFMALDGFQETHEIDVDELQLGKIYSMGNWNGLHQFLKKVTKKEHPKIVYMGDNLLQDVYAPSKHTGCDTVAVCEELEAEGVYGHEATHNDSQFLVSNTWGSYFHHKEHKNSTIWKDIIRNHSKICIPSLEFVAEYSIDYEFEAH